MIAKIFVWLIIIALVTVLITAIVQLIVAAIMSIKELTEDWE